LDLETMDVNGIKIPVAQSTCNNKTSKICINNSVLIETNIDLAVKNLWEQYFDYIVKRGGI